MGESVEYIDSPEYQDSPVYPFDKRADAIASLLLSHSRDCRDSLKPSAFRLCPGIRETREDLELGRGSAS